MAIASSLENAAANVDDVAWIETDAANYRNAEAQTIVLLDDENSKEHEEDEESEESEERAPTVKIAAVEHAEENKDSSNINQKSIVEVNVEAERPADSSAVEESETEKVTVVEIKGEKEEEEEEEEEEEKEVKMKEEGQAEVVAIGKDHSVVLDTDLRVEVAAEEAELQDPEGEDVQVQSVASELAEEQSVASENAEVQNVAVNAESAKEDELVEVPPLEAAAQAVGGGDRIVGDGDKVTEEVVHVMAENDNDEGEKGDEGDNESDGGHRGREGMKVKLKTVEFSLTGDAVEEEKPAAPEPTEREEVDEPLIEPVENTITGSDGGKAQPDDEEEPEEAPSKF